ncbi:MAG TPA: hypothetical protein VFY22_10155 [Hydrogenophaga sp.]|nr:hypothetical protein [Hydrogenophaga sp.]
MHTPINSRSHSRTKAPTTWLALAAMCLAAPACGGGSSSGASGQTICTDGATPAGAAQVGAHQLVIQDCPKLADVDFTGRADGRKYYNGLYFTKPRDRSLYEQAPDGLVLKRGGVVATVKMTSHPGLFPLLSGAQPFYIEAQVATSSNDPDNFPAIWLLPIEHNLRLEDVYPPDPKGFERWFELDIDEGGFGPGSHHTAISWSGKWPNYKKIQNPNPTSKVPLDRTQPNVFGVSYDPATLTVRWWLNGQQVLEAGPPAVPEVARRQNFYLIVSAQSHRNISDYQMKFMGVRAYVGAAGKNKAEAANPFGSSHPKGAK